MSITDRSVESTGLSDLQEGRKHACQMMQDLSHDIYDNNFRVGWWSSADEALLPVMGEKYSKECATLIASKLALCHSELSEALEGMRKNLMDDHLPHRKMVEVELADTIIRILDLCGYMRLDIGGAVFEKFKYNLTRADHKLANREAVGGKTI
jgi:NTP pyrophosphatase (non-canonical NTP hydrolase)